MWTYAIWLAGGLLWAQLVWDWHAEQDQGKGYHIPVTSSLVHSQLFHRVRLVGDTLWVMGNTCVRAMDTLYLPSTDAAKEVFRNLSGDPVAVSYIAGYDRVTGELKIAYLAYVTPSESYAIRFQDFAVSENQDTIWVAVDLPNGGGCRSRPPSGTISVNNSLLNVKVWSGSGSSTLNWQSTFSYQLHSAASAGQVWQITRSGNGVRCVPVYWTNNESDPGLSLGFWSLVRRPGIVYVSGTCRRPNTSQSPSGSFSSSEMNAAFPIRGSPEPAYGFILRLHTGNAFAITDAAAIGKDPGSLDFQTYGRNLIPYGDTIFFLVGIRSDGGNWGNNHILQAKSSSGALSTLTLGGLSGSYSGRVLLVGFGAGDLAPVTTLLGTLAFARLWNYDGSSLPQPPSLYPVVVEDTLYIAWSDNRSLDIQTGGGPVGSAGGSSRIYVMGWAGLSQYGSAGLSPLGTTGTDWPVYSNFVGRFPGAVSGMVRWGDTLWVSCTGGSNRLPPLFWVNRHTGQSLYEIPVVIASTLSDTAEIGGLAIDRWGHLYAAGIIRAQGRYGKVRPSATTVNVNLSRPYNVGNFGYGRSWVGRLLNYRYHSAGPVIPNRCVPDTIQGAGFSYTLWGHFSPGEKIAFTWESSNITSGNHGYLWRPGAVYTVSADRPDSLHVTLPWVAFPGAGSGSYTLQPRLLAWQRPDTLWRESGNPPRLSAGGYTLPPLYRVDSTERWWVVPFLGDKS